MDITDGQAASSPALDLVYVRNKLSGGGPIVQLLTAVAQSSTSVKLTWKVSFDLSHNVIIFSDRALATGGNAIASVRPSVCLSVSC